MSYIDKMDKECVSLCKAINDIEGLQTVESCCGHGIEPFRIWFKVKDLTHLPRLLYYLDPCHVVFRWPCTVYTDCCMSPVTFMIESEDMGLKAYQQAIHVACCLFKERGIDESNIPDDCLKHPLNV